MLIVGSVLYFVFYMELLLTALEQGITPAVIIAIYLLLTDVIKTRKEKKQVKLNSDTVEAINDIKVIVKDIYNKKEAENKEKCKIAIEDSFNSASFALINFMQRTLISNHLEANRESVVSNIHNAANAAYYSIFQTLSLYTINHVRVSDYIESQWLKDIETDLMNHIYNNTLSREDKFMGYINRLTITFQTYINYVQNKILK